jgi:hypothetical protein
MSELARFLSHTQRNEQTGCLEWTGAKTPAGRAVVKFRGINTTAARVSWYLHNGDLPDDVVVGIDCENRACVEPGHLFLATKAERSRIRDERGRGKAHLGNKLDPEKVAVIKARLLRGEKPGAIAPDYGVSGSMITRIGKGKSWKRVEPRIDEGERVT